MTRVLQLCPADADLQTARGVEALVGKLGPDFAVERKSIGRGGDWGNGARAVASLRRGDLRYLDVIHAWGPTALTAAALSGIWQLVYTPEPAPTRRSVNWLRAVMQYRDVQIVCPTSTSADTHLRHGVSPDRVHLIRPGVDFSRVEKKRNAELRARLGLADDDFVLLGAGESTRPANHRLALWATGILSELDSRYRLLVWGRGPQADALARFAEAMLSPALFVDARRRFGDLSYESLLTAADACLITADGPVATLPISVAAAAGLTMVATVTPTVAELLEDRHSALMVAGASPTPRAIAARVLDLRADAALQWKMNDAARAEAYEHFAVSKFVEEHRAIYGQKRVSAPRVRGAGQAPQYDIARSMPPV